jgi:hypothetical protein
MGRRSRMQPAALVVVLAVTLLAVGLTACGNKDKWVGTWVDVKDTKTGFVIESKGGDVYNVHDPDGSNAFDAKLGADGVLTGKVKIPNVNAMADVTIAYEDATGHLKLTVALSGQKLDYELQKK